MIGEVPGGTGLGSSSAVTVGLLHAVRTSLGLECSADTLARESVIIETEVLKKPIGWQDQYGVAFPALKKIVFNRDDTVQVEPIALAPRTEVPWKPTPCSCTRARREKRRRCCRASHRTWMPIKRLETIRSIAQDLMVALQDRPLDLPLMGVDAQ